MSPERQVPQFKKSTISMGKRPIEICYNVLLEIAYLQQQKLE